GRQVTGPVDGVVGAQAADVVLLLAGACGRDDGGAGFHDELEGDGAHAAGGSGHEHRLARLDIEGMDGVVGRDAGKTDDGRLPRLYALRDPSDRGGRCGDVVGERAGARSEVDAGDDARDP